MRKGIARLSGVLALVLGAAVPVAAQVTYTYTGSGFNFSFTQPKYVTANEHVTSFTTANVTSVDFCFPAISGGGCQFSYPQYSFISLNTNGASTYTYFDGNQFTSDGVKTTSNASPTPGTLTITGVPVTPEPATWFLMIAGFGVVGAALRRQRQLGRSELSTAQ